jgi:hypothetical protein
MAILFQESWPRIFLVTGGSVPKCQNIRNSSPYVFCTFVLELLAQLSFQSDVRLITKNNFPDSIYYTDDDRGAWVTVLDGICPNLIVFELDRHSKRF